MELAVKIELVACWLLWAYPFLFRAPHRQKRASITVATPTRVGLVLECAAVFIALAFRLPAGDRPGIGRLISAMAIAPIAVVLAWTSVRHLGRQFRVHAGLYHDHQLVRTGPYGVVRHPIYASVLAILIGTLLFWTPWPWIVASLALFVVGTEIRVRAEDGLLASRFGKDFQQYRTKVPAYIPFVR